MKTQIRACIHRAGFALLLALPTTAVPTAAAWQEPPRPAPVFTVDGRVALAALMALGDNHIAKMADSLQILAATPAAASGDWEQIRGPLAGVGEVNVLAVLWFAKPDGTYWTVEAGLAQGSLADRPYFQRLLAGQRVLGDLMVSRSTERNVVIAAVPIFGAGGAVTGILGSSIYLDDLSDQIRHELDLDSRMIFFSFDATPLIALDWDPDLILTDPMQLGDGVPDAFREMLAHDEGTVTYTFRGARRTVIYRKSPVTQWWYAFGLLENVPPVLTVPGKVETVVGSLVTFTAEATDPDHCGALAFSLSGAPAGAAIDPATGVFAWRPVAPGEFTFDVTVTDTSGLSDTKPVTVDVGPAVSVGKATATAKGKTVTVEIPITNRSETAAAKVTLTTATLAGVPATGSLKVGTIRPGATGLFTLRFKNVESGSAQLILEGRSSLGGFSSSQMVKVP